MENASRARLLRLAACLGLSAAAWGAGAAQLDLAADGVLGALNFTTIGSASTSATSLVGPTALTEDSASGVLWVTDTSASRVLRYSSAAAYANGEAANLVLGQANFTTATINRGAPVAANSMNGPYGVALDQAGRLYVADTGNNRVLVFKPPFSTGMNAQAVLGQASFTAMSCNRGGTVGSATLCGPRGVSLDTRGNLFVADTDNNRVLRFAGPVETGALPNRVYGQASYIANVQATSASGFMYPYQSTVDGAGHLWVVDTGNHRVLRFNDALAGDGVADVVLCQASFTTGTTGITASECTSPTGIAVDAAGVAYVSEFGNSRILQFTSPATGAAATGVIGQGNFTIGTCNRGLASPGNSTLCMPFMLHMDRSGNLHVADGNHRVLRYDLPRQRVQPAIANLSPATVPQGGAAFTLTVNGSGFYNGSVVNWSGVPRATQYLSANRLLAQVTAADIASAGSYAVTVTNPAPATSATSLLVNLPTYAHAALDTTADRVLGQPGFTTVGTTSVEVGEERLGAANAANLAVGGLIAVAVDRASGRLFVSDGGLHSRVLSWPSVSAFQNAQPADIVLGQPDEFSRGCNAAGLSAASLCTPQGLAVDPSGALYVSDRDNNRVLRFVPPFTTGMAASRVFGQGGSFTTNAANNGGVSANSLYGPDGLAVSGTALFVLDTGNYRILVFNNPATDFMADAAIGQANLDSAVAAVASSTRFVAGLGALALDSQGRLHLAAYNQNRVLRFSPPFASNMAADLVIGQPDFSSTAQSVTSTGLNGPIGIAFDPADNLLVSEYIGSRIVRYPAPLASAMAATGVIGQPGFVTSTANRGGAAAANTLANPTGIAMDRVGNLVAVDYGNVRMLGYDRPFAFTLDPAQDLDGDGIPNGVEVTESRDPYAKDNDLFSAGATSARLFAMQQYRDFLAREGDAAGISGWANLVTAGTYSRPQVIDAFLNSAEFGGVISPVVRLYYATFLRVPDYAGLTYNAGLIRAGTVSLQQLADFFVASPEFAATYGALNNTQFVTLLYQNVLGRAPDQAGLDGWVAILNGGASRGSVLIGFSESPEYKANMANEVLVTMMYAGMLRRTPETAGYNGWLAALDSGTYTAVQMIDGFYQSAEYHNRFLP